MTHQQQMIDANTLRTIQQEQKPWVKHNFGDRPPWMPFFGIIEELLDELTAAFEADPLDSAALEDALGDTMIFAIDYCSAVGWDVGSLWLDALLGDHPKFTLHRALGKVAHAHLKFAQNIRTGEDHLAVGYSSMADFLSNLGHVSPNITMTDLVQITHKIWQKVRQRDWQAFPQNGLTL